VLSGVSHVGGIDASDFQSAALKSVSVRLRPRAPLEHSVGQGQPTAAAESNNISVLASFLNEYTPPLISLRPAQRYADDLSVYACEPARSQQWSRRIGLLVRNKLIF
jgi:hypothetical protein